jgi:hypothetical protein
MYCDHLFPGIFPSLGRRREFRQPLVQVLVIRFDAHRLGFDLFAILLYAPFLNRLSVLNEHYF